MKSGRHVDVGAGEQAIPRIIHCVWVGPQKPKLIYLDQWRRLLPSYRFMLWHEGNIDFNPLFIRTAYAARAYNRVANYARVAGLYRHGGIYMDHDVELLSSWDGFLDQPCFVGFETDNPSAGDMVNNAIIGAVPGHPFLARVLTALDAMDGRWDVGSGSGPGLLSRLLRESGPLQPSDEVVHRDGVTIYPKRIFYPYEYGETFTPDCVKQDTVAIHHWDFTWGTNKSSVKRLKKRVYGYAARLAPDVSFRVARWQNLRARRGAAGLPQDLA